MDIHNSIYGYPKIMLNIGYPKIEFWISMIICSDSRLKLFLPTSVTGRFGLGTVLAISRFGPVSFQPELFRPWVVLA